MSASEKIFGLIVDQTGLALNAIQGSSKLIDDLEMDSLDLVELVMAIEDEFDFEITDEEMDPIKTVDELTTLVNQKLKPCLG